jgi:RNA polymerase sigma-70 factor (ECF subfamily)
LPKEERFQLCSADELARLAREGDLCVLDHLTRCYGERLFAIGRRHCRSLEDAEDAVQEALLSAGKKLESWRGDAPLEAWVGRMVANACHKLTRGRKNDPTLHTTEAEVEGGPSPELEARRAELATTLGEALLGLDPRDRVIVLLAETEDWTGPQIAEKMGMTPAAVRQRLSRARTKMRGQIVTQGFQL